MYDWFLVNNSNIFMIKFIYNMIKNIYVKVKIQKGGHKTELHNYMCNQKPISRSRSRVQ